MDSLEINGNKAPEPEASSTPGGLAALHMAAPRIEDSNYILLQVKGPLDGPEKQALQENGVIILEYKGNDVYLCGFKPINLKEVVKSLDFVVRAEVYKPAFVVESSLQSADESQGADGGDEETEVEIVLHDDVHDGGCSHACEAIAASTGLSLTDIHLSDGKAKIKVPKSKLFDIARIDEVKTINRSHAKRLFNNVGGRIMEVHKPVGLNSVIYKGKGQIVCVCDTGFDKGSKDDVHAAFRDDQGKSRVIATIALGRKEAGISDDLDGHGTHVSGSVLGNGNHSEQKAIEAPASEAKLIVQSVFDDWDKEDEHDRRKWYAGLGGIPNTWPELFDSPFKQGARIHTNSWGGPPAPYQSAETGKLDLYLRNKKKLVVLFAAGNEGTDRDRTQGRVDPYSLGSLAVAKNTITVGATE